MRPTSMVRIVATAAIATVVLAAGGGGALADEPDVAGDAITFQGSTGTLAFGSVPCGADTTKAITVKIQRVGNSDNSTFGNGAAVDINATATATALTFVRPTDHAVDLPPSWGGAANQSLSLDSVVVNATLRPTAAGAGSATMTVTAVGPNKASPSSVITLSENLAVTWTAGSCTPPRKATTTTVTCSPTSVPYTGSARTPCSATTTETVGGAFVASPTVTYGSNTNVGTVTASASFSQTATHEASSGSTTFQITAAPTTTTVTCPASVAYTGSAQTPCSATVTGPGLNQPLTPSYANNTTTGSATASASYAGSTNLAASSDSKNFTIGQATTNVSVTCAPGPYTYTGSPIAPSCSAVATGPGLNQSLPVSFSNNTNAGGATASASYAGDANHAPATGSTAFSIGKATATCVVPDVTATYTGDLKSLTGSCSGVGGADLTSVLTIGPGETDAGTYGIAWSFDGDPNYGDLSGTSTLTIGQATPNCTISGFNGAYTGTARGAAGECLDVNGDVLDGLDLGATYINVPGGMATWGLPTSQNYAAVGGSVPVAITKATPVCAIEGATVDYDGSAHGADGTCRGVDGTELGGLLLGTSFTNVPGGTAMWTLPESSNHKGATGEALITIDPIDATCAISGFNGTYNGLAHGARGSCTGIGTESPGMLDLGASFTDAPGGTANWTLTGNDNYNDHAGTAAIVIGKATADCELEGYSDIYDALAHGASGTCTGVDGSALAGLDLGASYINVPGGPADWTFTGGTNYADDSGSVDIDIAQAASSVTLICDGASVYTGAEVTPCHATAARVGDDPVEVEVSYSPNVNAGPVTATATWEGDVNHSGDTADDQFTIAKAAPVCTITGYTGDYTATPHGALGACMGVDDSDLTDSLDRGASHTNVPGGITTWTLSESSNHLGASNTVTVMIDPIAATCSISGHDGTYDGLAHGATGGCTGIGGESPGTLDLGALFTNVPGGTASWSLSGNDNYDDQADEVNIGIGKATATCDIDGYGGVYDAAAHGAKGTCTGVDDDVLPGLNLGSSFTNVPGGSADWTFTGGTNYADDSGSVDIEISKATSTVALFCDGAKTYTGAAVRPCTATASRVGDDPVQLDVGYTPNVDAGPVTATATWDGDDNHNGDTADEQFAIAKAAPVCSISGYTGPYTATPHGALGTCLGVDGTDLAASLDSGVSYIDVAGGSVTWTLSESANHLGDSDSVTVTISPIDATCSITGFTGTFDGLAHGATGTCTGIGGENPGTLDLGTTFTDVPGGTATWSLTGNDNYKDTGGTVNIAIAKAASHVKVTCPTSVSYTGSPQTPCTASVTGAGGLDESVPVTHSGHTDAGTATASAAYAGDGNHTGSSDSATFQITPAVTTTTVTCPATVTYNGSAHTPCTGKVTGPGSLDQTLTVTYADNTNAGTATASSDYVGTSNYQASHGTRAFTINKAASTVTVTCPAGPYYYTGTAITPTCTARVAGAGGLDLPVSPVTLSDNVAVGTAKASATYAGDGNHVGHTGTTTFTIGAWRAGGFYQPVDMGGVWNTVKAGSTVPLKFELFSGASELTSTTSVKSFTSTAISCSALSTTAEDAIELTTTGGTTLRYDTTGGQFIQNWQTPKSVGGCYRVTMTAADSTTVIAAYFKLK